MKLQFLKKKVFQWILQCEPLPKEKEHLKQCLSKPPVGDKFSPRQETFFERKHVEPNGVRSCCTGDTGYVGWTGEYSEFDSWWGREIFSRLALGHTGLFPWGQSRRGMKLATHLHLVPRLRIAELYLHSTISLQAVVLK
jgi:hypothetical protein